MHSAKGEDESSGKIDPEAFISVELSTSGSIVQVRRKKIDLLVDLDIVQKWNMKIIVESLLYK